MNKKIFVVLALASLFVSTQAAYGAITCADANCVTCGDSSAGSCTVCASGYFLTTVAATASAAQTTTCTACNSAFNGKCKTCTDATATTCTAAVDGYYIASGAPVTCNAAFNGKCKTCTDGTATTCTAAVDGYYIASGAPVTCNAAFNGNCKTCTDGTATTCTVAASGYYVSSGAPVTCNAAFNGKCATCTDGTATTCTAAVSGYYVVSGAPVACGDTYQATACSAVDTATTCSKGTLGSGICCGVKNCGTCMTSAAAATAGLTAGANNVCATCSGTYTLQSDKSCNCVTNCAFCASGTTCYTCATGYAGSGGSTNAYTSCVATTPVPSTSSPGSAFNVTPAVVYTTTDTTSPAFTAVSGTTVFGPGADSTSAYVWLLVNPASTTGSTYSINKRTVNTSGTFAKSNTTADVAISTSLLANQIQSYGTAPGWMWLVSINCGYSGTSCNWNSIGGTAVTQEITLNYVAGTGSSLTAKALTGNTNANVFFTVKSSWYNNGTIFVAYVMSTRTTGATAGSVADTWAANGLYIQGVNVTSGALYYNTTGGVKAISMTQTASGASTCIATTGSGCASAYYSGTGVGDALSSFTVYPMNWTTTDTVQYTWVDRTSTTAIVYKTGTINCTTGAATSGTTLATSAADAVSGTTTTSTSYSFLGGLASMGTYGVFLKKTVGTTVGSAATTYVYTIQGFLNGSSTANTNFTVASGYNPSSITGYHTSDGFVLMETQYSTASTTPAQPNLLQAERFFTNGSAYSTAVNLGTYGAAATSYQDTNGSVIVGYTIYDTLTSKTYSGYMGTYIAQNLAGVSLTTIFGLLCFMIVALFAF